MPIDINERALKILDQEIGHQKQSNAILTSKIFDLDEQKGAFGYENSVFVYYYDFVVRNKGSFSNQRRERTNIPQTYLYDVTLVIENNDSINATLNHFQTGQLIDEFEIFSLTRSGHPDDNKRLQKGNSRKFTNVVIGMVKENIETNRIYLTFSYEKLELITKHFGEDGIETGKVVTIVDCPAGAPGVVA